MFNLEVFSIDELEQYIENNIDTMSDAEAESLFQELDKRVKQDSYDMFVEYNETDVLLVEQIDNKMKFVQLAIVVAHLTRSRLNEIFGTIKAWDNLIYNMLLKDNIQIPPEKYRESEPFAGAFVKDPIAGFYKWVASVDLTSLYPSIIMMFNMSPETLVDRAVDDTMGHMFKLMNKEIDTTSIKERGLALSANGSTYKFDKVGVIPNAMSILFNGRKAVKGDMKKEKQKKEDLLAQGINEHDDRVINYDMEIQMLDAKQLALKILANSGYGAIGNANFRYFVKDIAEAITLTGQLAIRNIANDNNKFLREKCGTDENSDYVLMVDTDSNYVWLDDWVKKQKLDENNINVVVDAIDNFMQNEFEPNIDRSYNELSDYLGAPKNYLDMKREAIADKCIIRGKKNYIIQIYDNEHVRYAEPYIKQMGIETAKSSTAKFIREALSESLNIVLNGTETQIRDYEREFKQRFMNISVEDISAPRGVSDLEKWIDRNGEAIKGTPFHVRASIVHNKIIQENPELAKKYQKIKSGDKIKLIALKKANPVFNRYIAYHDDLPPEFGLHEYIARDTQYEKTFFNPLKTFTDLMEWELKPKPKIDDLFDDDIEDSRPQLHAVAVVQEQEKKRTARKKVVLNIDDLF